MSKASTGQALPLNCAVITISDSRSANNDSSGDYLVQSLQEAGHLCVQRLVSKGNLYEIRKHFSDWILDDDIQVILANGGTGFSHDKTTAKAVLPLLDQTITGFGELFRYLSYQDIGSSMLQSDAFAGIANNTLVFCLPGSTGACKTAWEHILREQLDSTHRPCNFGAAFHA